MLPPRLAPIQVPVNSRHQPHHDHLPAPTMVAAVLHIPLLHTLADRRVCLLRCLVSPGTQEITRPHRLRGWQVAGADQLDQ